MSESLGTGLIDTSREMRFQPGTTRISRAHWTSWKRIYEKANESLGKAITQAPMSMPVVASIRSANRCRFLRPLRRPHQKEGVGPSPAILYHSPQFWLLACEAWKRAKDVMANDPESYEEDAVGAIILSATAAEGFINELQVFISGIRRACDIPDRVKVFARKHEEIEAIRSSTGDPSLSASHLLSGKVVDKGRNPYQRLRPAVRHTQPSRASQASTNRRA